MKIVRKNRPTPMKVFADFVRDRLPESLRLDHIQNAYANDWVVLRAGDYGGWIRHPVEIARLDLDGVVLNAPEYFSDFELILLAWEREHPGREATLTYWETA